MLRRLASWIVGYFAGVIGVLLFGEIGKWIGLPTFGRPDNYLYLNFEALFQWMGASPFVAIAMYLIWNTRTQKVTITTAIALMVNHMATLIMMLILSSFILYDPSFDYWVPFFLSPLSAVLMSHETILGINSSNKHDIPDRT